RGDSTSRSRKCGSRPARQPDAAAPSRRSARTTSTAPSSRPSTRSRAGIRWRTQPHRRSHSWATVTAVRRYHVTTFGCQMNAHDSERIKGLLEELGLGEAPSQQEADVIVLNTCTIREKPDTRFAAHMGNAAKLKRERPGTVVAVGGCYAEAQRERLFTLYPDVDVAFGPGTISHLGTWLGAGGGGGARAGLRPRGPPAFPA